MLHSSDVYQRQSGFLQMTRLVCDILLTLLDSASNGDHLTSTYYVTLPFRKAVPTSCTFRNGKTNFPHKLCSSRSILDISNTEYGNCWAVQALQNWMFFFSILKCKKTNVRRNAWTKLSKRQLAHTAYHIMFASHGEIHQGTVSSPRANDYLLYFCHPHTDSAHEQASRLVT